MIDVKQLRIGCHVNVLGVRAKVTEIDKPYGYRVFVEGISPETNEKMTIGATLDKVEPIPLSAELLQELGFEHRESGCWLKSQNNVFVWLTKKYARGYIFPSDETGSSDVIIPPNLHSLENIIYFTIGKELIEE